MNSYVLGFQEIDKTKLAIVGGKGVNLGELSRIEGIEVPEGFCVTTKAYKEIIGNNRKFHSLLDQLSLIKVDTGKVLVKSVPKSAKSSKKSLFRKILKMRLPVNLNSLVKKMPMPYVPAPRWRTWRQLPLQASRIHTLTSSERTLS